jgi:hypothetical protein
MSPEMQAVTIPSKATSLLARSCRQEAKYLSNAELPIYGTYG